MRPAGGVKTTLTRSEARKALPPRFVAVFSLRCPGAAASTSALTPWAGEPLARGFARQDANALVGLGRSEDPALGIVNPRPGFGRTDHGCRMTLGEEGVQGRLGPVRREGREQSARGEGRPGVGAEDPAQGGPGSEPEYGPPVDPEEDARGTGHLVQARGEATFGRVVKGGRPPAQRPGAPA